MPVADPSAHGTRAAAAQRRRAEPGEPAERVPFSHALPEGAGALLACEEPPLEDKGTGTLAACHYPAAREELAGDRRTISAMSTPSARPPEAEELLQRLIRFNTVNPPGNERPAQEYLAGHLTRGGL